MGLAYHVEFGDVSGVGCADCWCYGVLFEEVFRYDDEAVCGFLLVFDILLSEKESFSGFLFDVTFVSIY